MMNLYRRTNSGTKRRLVMATLLVAVLFAIDLLSGGKVHSLAQNITGDVSGTTVRVFQALKDSGFFRTRASLAAQNQDLQTTIARYQAQADAYKALKEENDQLSLFAHLAQDNSGTTTPVVSSSHSSPYGTFLIGAGATENIKHNALVLSDDRFVVGRVIDVSIHTSLVSQLLSPDKSIDALIGKSPATFVGTASGNAKAQVPRDIKVAVGDVVTSGSVGGRPIGIVGKVVSQSSDAYSTVYMRLPQNVSAMRFVFVLASTQ
ncbi:rod shape-determining protein MreC [Candidatus Kaiserbacteria bacterium]|nr:rod shape-determining protein MreC [Candidatus Kaiserbacteria bacterium]